MTKSSRRPWRIKAPPVADNGNPWFVQDADYHTIAIVPRAPRESHAKLFAASRGLLDVAKEILRGSKTWYVPGDTLDRLEYWVDQADPSGYWE